LPVICWNIPFYNREAYKINWTLTPSYVNFPDKLSFSVIALTNFLP